MSTDSACIARLRSSASRVTLLYLTPASGLNSNVVTTGPGWNCATEPATENSRHFSSSRAALSMSTRSSNFWTALGESSSARGGWTNEPLRCSADVLSGRSSRGSMGVMPAGSSVSSSSGGAGGGSAFSGCGARAGGWLLASTSARAVDAPAFSRCLRTTSRRCRSRRRLAHHCRTAPCARCRSRPRARAACRNRRPKENCVTRIRARDNSASRTMIDPARFRYGASSPATLSPTYPPARTLLPRTSTVPNARVSSVALHPNSRMEPTSLVYAASIGRHQK